MPDESSEHYLKRELYQRARSDPSILTFLETAVTDGLWFRDPEKSQQWMSPRCKELLGYTDDEMPDALQWCIDNIHPDDLQVALDNYAKHALDPSHRYDQVVRYRHKDGSTVWVRCRGMAIRDKNGKPTRLLGAHTDVTALKQAEADLRSRQTELTRAVNDLNAERRLLRALIDNSPDLIYIKDTESRFLIANRALAHQVGVADPEDVIGKSDFDLHPPGRSAEYHAREQDVLNGEPMLAQRERSFDKEGKARWFSSTKAPLRDDQGKVIGLVGVGRDITHQKHAEDELSRAYEQLELRVQQRTNELTRTVEELKNANRELDAFAHMASHGLQEPLRNLISFASLLEEDLGESLPEPAAQDLHFIAAAALRMRKLVQNLLALSRAGRAKPHFNRLRLDDCVEESLEALRSRLDESGARVKRTSLPEVTGDRTMLTQLYENLLANALKFNGGREPEIELTSEKTNHGWVLGVRDRGIGLKPEHTDLIFAPFSRLHGTEEYEGSGIGLAICRKAVERHGGAIWVESEFGKGAHFKFTLPTEPTPVPS